PDSPNTFRDNRYTMGTFRWRSSHNQSTYAITLYITPDEVRDWKLVAIDFESDGRERLPRRHSVLDERFNIGMRTIE
ncbi:hypothetical protein H0H93_002915, partial [Arthromyces matolae]